MNIEKFKAKQEKYNQILAKDCRKILHPYIKDFMGKNPEITGIRWEQFTPYFNDGEPCVFRIYEIFYTTKDLTKFTQEQLFESVWELDEGEEVIWYETYSDEYKALLPETKASLRSLRDLFEGKLEEIVKLGYGDGADVLIRRTSGNDFTIDLFELEDHH